MVYVFDPRLGEWIMENPMPDDPIPGTKHGLLTVRALRGRSVSGILWSDLRALDALQTLLALAAPHTVRYAFRRLGEGAHTGQSAHYAGLAFDIGHKLDPEEQMRLASLALERCGFDRVEPLFTTPGWLHVEKQIAQPACIRGGYPSLRQGARGVHVFVLQDALLLHGMAEGGLTGCFSAATAADVRRFQNLRRLSVTGEADCATWRALMQPAANRRKD